MAVTRVFAGAFNIAKRTSYSQLIKVSSRYFHVSNCAFAERLYTNKHEWVEVQGKIGIVGISQYAQEALGDVVFAQLPDVDTVLKQKDECGALESVKAASEIYSPISGKVLEKNIEVEDKPSLINTSCYEKGWLFKVELSNESEIKELMTEDKYKEFLKTVESH
ncbi:glycine cleavage system H protein, mitochondrial [Diorhabda carinulata]|uniref:glycine cleavage system H protein, mitochondrial n=1 Tax=Diorhabda carinulata TaxID=1163345 RepID=UPI00259FEC19|nr:glycine cleavage system H protein, mitochondrial [Diorhabda carinulata]